MANLKEQDIVFTTKDADGNTVIQMPVTRIENVEGGVRSVNGNVVDENGNVVDNQFNHKSINPIPDLANDTVPYWSGIEAGTYWFDMDGVVSDKPSEYGHLVHIFSGQEIFQLWKCAPNAALYHRGGNSVGGWNGTWKKVATTMTFTPDFSSLVWIGSLPFTAPVDCFVMICAVRRDSTDEGGCITINGWDVLPFQNVGGKMIGDVTTQLWVKKGDVINVIQNAQFAQGYYCGGRE